MEFDPAAITPDRVFDGGDLDCGSGLVLLIRENMLRTPENGILEMRSREPTVAADLPPWCRMAGHVYLGKTVGDGYARYFVRKGSAAIQEEEALEKERKRPGNTSGACGPGPPAT
jgi:TusA-related sulfurtransferase